MSSNDPLIEIKKLISGNYYIEAVDFCSHLERLTPKSPFQELLFGEQNHIFIKALRQAVKHENELWLCQLLPDDNQSLSDKVAPWFTKIKGEADWCADARSGLLKAQIICAKKAI